MFSWGIRRSIGMNELFRVVASNRVVVQPLVAEAAIEQARADGG